MINQREITRNINDLEYEKIRLKKELKDIESKLMNLHECIPSYDKNKDIKMQLKALLSAYGMNDAIKVVSVKYNSAKTEYKFELVHSHKILKIFNKDLGNRKLFNQAKHYLGFLPKYDMMLIKREQELISFCIPEDTDIWHSVQYSGSKIISISFYNVASNIQNMKYIEKSNQLTFEIKTLPYVLCNIEVESHEELYSTVKYCQQLIRKH